MLLLLAPFTLLVAAAVDFTSGDSGPGVIEKEFLPTLKHAYRDLSHQEKMGGLQSGFEEALSLYFMYLDPAVPWEKKRPTIDALMYFINPVDDTPDFASGGWVDDFQKIHQAYQEASSAVTAEHRQRASEAFKSLVPDAITAPGIASHRTLVTFVKDLQIEPTIERKLWKLEGPPPKFDSGTPYDGDYGYVITSLVSPGANAIVDRPTNEKEGFVFPATSDGKQLAWATVTGTSSLAATTSEDLLSESGFETAHTTMSSPSEVPEAMGGVLSSVGEGIGKGVVGVVKGVGSVAVGIGKGIGKGVAGAVKTSPKEAMKKEKRFEKKTKKKEKDTAKNEEVAERHDAFQQGMEEESAEAWQQEQEQVSEVIAEEGYGEDVEENGIERFLSAASNLVDPSYQAARNAKIAFAEEFKSDPNFKGVTTHEISEGQYALLVFGDFSEDERYVPSEYDGIPVILDSSRRPPREDGFGGDEEISPSDLASYLTGQVELAYPWRVEGLPPGWKVQVRAKEAAMKSHPPGARVLHPGMWQIELTLPGQAPALLATPLHISNWPSVEGAPDEFVLWYKNGMFVWGIDNHEHTPDVLGIEDGVVSDDRALAQRASIGKATANRIPVR